MRALIIEDEPDLRAAIARVLADEGFAADTSGDGEDGLYRILEGPYDVIVLDLMLPKRDGWQVLQAMRQAGHHTPVLVLTARDAIPDRVRGLNQGADDYLSKPFAPEELVARLRALVRRAAAKPAPEIVVHGLRVNLTARRVFRGASEITLTGREFGILELLTRRRGAIVTRRAIADRLYDEATELHSNAIDVHVAALRRKLGPDVIQTRRGLGYLIDV